MNNTDAYTERVLEHDRNPRNKHWLEGADIESHGMNTACGDDVLIQLRLDGERINEIAFTGYGCSISQAVASMLTELAKGRDLEWVEKTSDEDIFRELRLGGHRKMRGSCELLGIKALRNGVSKYRSLKPRSTT